MNAAQGADAQGAQVLVVGGGVAGIQAALDLGDMGMQVHLVEQKPSIGGRMAQLDKTFPTNDCSLCILAPKMAECSRHPNVTLHTNSQVTHVTGSAGAFKVDVYTRARYVKESDCTNCLECTQKCPAKVVDEFDMGLRMREAVYTYFLQAVPAMVSIDREHCLYLTKGRCGLCKRVCEAGAIDYEQEDQEFTLDVAAIVLATGFDPFDPAVVKPYGYGKYRNVITSMEYERLISASGPTGGHLWRQSDREPVKTLAFLQCVGSRNLNHNRFCSSVCCMYATKEAILANEHDRQLKSTIYYTDLRAAGKGFQEYVARAKREYKVNYVRARVAEITQDEQERPVIWYEDTEGSNGNGSLPDGKKSQTVDLVVLAVSLEPRRGAQELADLMGIDLDEYNFVKTDPFNMADTTRPGVFACGYCRGPADIPESVAQASGAAARAAEVVAQTRSVIPVVR
jgi:heterodisulfide reductase subunit A